MNKTLIAIIAISLVVISAVVYFFDLPTMKNYQETKSSISSKQEEINQSNLTLKKYSEVLEKKELLKQYAQKTSSMVPKDPDIEDFLIELEDMISQSKIPDTEFRPSALSSTTTGDKSPSVISSAQNYQITINGESSLENIIDFINQFKRMSRLTEITSLDLAEGEQNSHLRFSIIANIFSNKTPNTPKIKDPNKILTQAITKIEDYQSYGKDIEIQTEEGFGRSNPFISY